MANTKLSKQPVDVPADNPTGTMRRFTEGLKRVLKTDKDDLRPSDRLKRQLRPRQRS